MKKVEFIKLNAMTANHTTLVKLAENFKKDIKNTKQSPI